MAFKAPEKKATPKAATAKPVSAKPAGAVLKPLNKNGGTPPKPYVVKDGKPVPNPARFAKASQPTGNNIPATPKAAAKSATPTSTQNPVRQQVSIVASKPVRESLYGLAATIEAIKKIDPKQAQALQRQFDALVKQKNLTAGQVQRVTGGLFNSGQALANSKGLSQPNAGINGTVFGQQVIKNYDAYIGQSKNTNIPGIGNLFGYRNLPKNTPENAALAAVVGSGMMVGSIDGLKNAVGGLIDKVGTGKTGTNAPKTVSPTANIKSTQDPKTTKQQELVATLQNKKHYEELAIDGKAIRYDEAEAAMHFERQFGISLQRPQAVGGKPDTSYDSKGSNGKLYDFKGTHPTTQFNEDFLDSVAHEIKYSVGTTVVIDTRRMPQAFRDNDFEPLINHLKANPAWQSRIIILK